MHGALASREAEERCKKRKQPWPWEHAGLLAFEGGDADACRDAAHEKTAAVEKCGSTHNSRALLSSRRPRTPDESDAIHQSSRARKIALPSAAPAQSGGLVSVGRR